MAVPDSLDAVIHHSRNLQENSLTPIHGSLNLKFWQQIFVLVLIWMLAEARLLHDGSSRWRHVSMRWPRAKCATCVGTVATHRDQRCATFPPCHWSDICSSWLLLVDMNPCFSLSTPIQHNSCQVCWLEKTFLPL